MKQAWIASLFLCTVGLAQEQPVPPAQPMQPVPPVPQQARVFFAFEDAPLHRVLSTIAKISGRSVEASAEIRERPVTFRVKNLPWRDAVTAIASSVGATVIEEDGTLRVVARDELVTKHFQPKCVVLGSDLLEKLRSELTPRGTIEFFDKNNLLIVRDERDVVDRIDGLIRQQDLGLPELEKQLREIALRIGTLSRTGAATDAAQIAKLLATTEEITRQLRALQQQHQPAAPAPQPGR